MVKENTKQVRIFCDGQFQKLVELIKSQFEKKHGFVPSSKELCEVIAKAVMDAKLF